MTLIEAALLQMAQLAHYGALLEAEKVSRRKFEEELFLMALLLPIGEA
jgi:hypothetical protein